MEAIGAGAGVLTFLTVALGSTKIAYETLSSVKDGSENVKRTENAVHDLSSILEHIFQLCESHPAATDPALLGDVRACVAHIDTVAAKLSKLQPLVGERRDGKLWKRFKAFISEKELDTVRETISRHYARLNMRLSILMR
jgi:hypothetical protein